jgi:hypothetical protein
MKIFCEDSGIFEEPQARRQFQRLLFRVSEGKHSLILRDVDGFLKSSFLAQESEVDRQEWEELILRASFASELENRTEEPGARPTGIHASVEKTRGKRTAACRFVLSMHEIGDWADEPLRLLLENDRDFSLLEAAARAYGFSEIEEAYVQKWLVVDGRGGCGEVLNRIKHRGDNERLFVMVDRDPDPSTGKQSSTSVAIERECKREPRVPFHVTKKREIENYVPEAILAIYVYQGMRSSATRARRPGLNTKQALFLEWKALSDAGKDMDDLKKRFGESLMENAVKDLRNPQRCTAEDFKARARTSGIDELDLALQELATHL